MQRMKILGAGVICVATCLMFTGCRRDQPRTMDRPSQGSSVRAEADALQTRIAEVQGAQSGAAEADALRRLRAYWVENGLTYRIVGIRTDDNVAVAAPSMVGDPVRAEVTVFRGRDILRTFQFVPRDNRNLALLGE